MASLNVNDAGTWRALKSINVNDSATWRALKSLWANDSGTWRKIFEALVVSMPANEDCFSTGGNATVTLDQDGTFSGVGASSGSFSTTWGTPTGAGAGAGFDVFCSTASTLVGSATNTFLNLGTIRSWTNSFVAGGSIHTTATCVISVYATTDHATPLATCTVLLRT